jgi:hypothetical protein
MYYLQYCHESIVALALFTHEAQLIDPESRFFDYERRGTKSERELE